MIDLISVDESDNIPSDKRNINQINCENDEHSSKRHKKIEVFSVFCQLV